MNTDLKRIETLYTSALTLFQEVGQAVENNESDAIIYDKSDSCSNKLYTAVEYTMKVIGSKYITNFSFDEQSNLAKLCNKINQYIPEDLHIDLNSLVIEKEARNLLTHSARLSRINNFARVFINLRRLIWFLSPDLELEEAIKLREDTLRFNEIASLLDFQNYIDNSHVLITDSLNDIDSDKLNLLANIKWDTVYDFGLNSTRIGLRSYRDTNAHKTLFLDPDDIHSVNDHYLNISKTKWINMNVDECAVPKKLASWKKDRKSIEKYVMKSFNLHPSDVTIVSLKRYNPVVEMIIDFYLLYFSNVKVILLNEFDEELSKNIDKRYEEGTVHIQFASLFSVCDTFNKYKRIFDFDVNIINEFYLPGRDGKKQLDIAMKNNLEDCFEVLHNRLCEESDSIKDYSDFLMGHFPKWSIFKDKRYTTPVEEEVFTQFISDISNRLNSLSDKPSDKLFSVVHEAGYGGSTLLRRIAWELHERYPVLIIKKYSRSSIRKLIIDIYDTYKLGVLVLVDDELITRTEVDDFENLIKGIDRPIASVVCRRKHKNVSDHDKKTLMLDIISDNCISKISQDYKQLSISLGNKFDFEKIDTLMNKVVGSKDLCPFILGLYYLEENFIGVEDYVKRSIKSITDKLSIDMLLAIAFTNYYARVGLPKGIISTISGTSTKDTSLSRRFTDLNNLLIETVDLHVNNAKQWRSKHYLISKEIVKTILINNDESSSNSYRDYLLSYAEEYFKKLIDVSTNSIPEVICETLTEVFINSERDDTEDNIKNHDYSLLIQEIPDKNARINLLEKISEIANKKISSVDTEFGKNEWHFLSHLWAHVGRMYYKEFDNFKLAQEMCVKAIDIMNEIELEDPIIYHIYGSSIARSIQYNMRNIENSNDTSKEEVQEFFEYYQEAHYYLTKSHQLGNSDYAIVSIIRMGVEFLRSIFRIYKLNDISSIPKLNMSFLNTIISDINDLESTVDLDELKPNSLVKWKESLRAYQSLLYKNNKGKLLEILDNEISKLKKENVHNSSMIYSINKLIVLTLLNHYDSYDSLTQNKKDCSRIFDILDDNFKNDTYRTFDCFTWFRLAKHTEKSLDDGLVVAKKWIELQEESKTIDPRPYYYMSTIKLLQSLDGYTTSLDESTHVLKECKDICRNEENHRIVNTSRPRDWFVKGKGLSQLLDDSEVEHIQLSKNSNLVNVNGVIDSFDNRNTAGYIKIREPRELFDAKVFFKPSETKLTINQKNHPVSFNMAFTYERIMAFNRSIELLEKNINKPIKKSPSTINRTNSQNFNSAFSQAYRKALESEKGR